MTLLFISLSFIIAIIVIAVSAKNIKAGIKARSEIKDIKETSSLSSTDEDAIKKLKEKNLSPEDLKKIYEELQRKKD